MGSDTFVEQRYVVQERLKVAQSIDRIRPIESDRNRADRRYLWPMPVHPIRVSFAAGHYRRALQLPRLNATSCIEVRQMAVELNLLPLQQFSPKRMHFRVSLRNRRGRRIISLRPKVLFFCADLEAPKFIPNVPGLSQS